MELVVGSVLEIPSRGCRETSSAVPTHSFLLPLPHGAPGTEFWSHRPPSGIAPQLLGCSDPGKTITVQVMCPGGGWEAAASRRRWFSGWSSRSKA